MGSLLTPAGLTLVVLIAASVILSALFLWAYVKHPRPRPSVRLRDDAKWDLILVGSAMWRVGPLPWRVTAPMAKLALGPDGVRLGPNGNLRWLVPTWEFRWGDLREVRPAFGGWTFITREKGEWLRFVPAIGTDRRPAQTILAAHVTSG
jgi:hypothetical protein